MPSVSSLRTATIPRHAASEHARVVRPRGVVEVAALREVLRGALRGPAGMALLAETDADGWAHGACWPLALAVQAWLQRALPGVRPVLTLVTSRRLNEQGGAVVVRRVAEHVVVQCELGGRIYLIDGTGVRLAAGWLRRYAAAERLDAPAFAPYDPAPCRARDFGWWGPGFVVRLGALLDGASGSALPEERVGSRTSREELSVRAHAVGVSASTKLLVNTLRLPLRKQHTA